MYMHAFTLPCVRMLKGFVIGPLAPALMLTEHAFLFAATSACQVRDAGWLRGASPLHAHMHMHMHMHMHAHRCCRTCTKLRTR